MSTAEDLFMVHCRANGLIPEREHRFAPPRRWRFDFAWSERKVAVEVEGGVWTNGRHTRGSGFVKDIEKYNAAAMLGWRVLRFTPGMVKSGKAVEMAQEAILKG